MTKSLNFIKNTLLAFLVILAFNITSFVPSTLTSNTQISQYAITQQVYAANDATSAAQRKSEEALANYQTFLGQDELYPNLTGAGEFFALILKFVSFVLGLCGMLFVVILGVRVVFDLLIVGLGWDPEAESDEDGFGGIKGFVFGLSSFARLGHAGKESAIKKKKSMRMVAVKKFSVPDDFGTYFKEFWLDIFISLVCGGLLLSGQIYPLTSKLLGVAQVGINTIMGLDFDGEHTVELANQATNSGTPPAGGTATQPAGGQAGPAVTPSNNAGPTPTKPN